MDNEVIVELLGEGGNRALYGVRTNGGWLFATDIIAQTNPPTTASGQPVVDSWSNALVLLDRNPGWPALTPRHIHPEFGMALWSAVTERTDPASQTNGLLEWEAECDPECGPSAALVVSDPVHSTDAWLYDEIDDLAPSDKDIERLRRMLQDQGNDQATIDRMAPRRKR